MMKTIMTINPPENIFYYDVAPINQLEVDIFGVGNYTKVPEDILSTD